MYYVAFVSRLKQTLNEIDLFNSIKRHQHTYSPLLFIVSWGGRQTEGD